jgi:chromosome segregation ATPase
VKALVDAVRSGADPAGAGLGVPDDTSRALGSLLRVDSGYGRAARRLSLLDHQLSGLRRSMDELDDVSAKLSAQKGTVAQSDTGLSASPADKVARIESQIRELKRLLREAERAGKKGPDVELLGKELAGLEVQARAARASLTDVSAAPAAKGEDLPGLIAADREQSTKLYQASAALRLQAEKQQLDLAQDALTRLDQRLSRLLRRARLGRIETVLGKKRSLEIEIEALAQGLLPQTIVDSLDAQRYLQDDEEFWPFEGEDWEDEYVGGEGLR